MTHNPEPTILANMCMVTDTQGRFLTENRVDRHWPGVVFPGGHVEKGESLTAAVIREVYEETGLTIEQPILCGVKHYCDTQGNHTLVFLYKAHRFSGELRSSEEGEIRWMTMGELKAAPLAHGFEQMLALFLDDSLTELYYPPDSNGQFEIH